MATSIAPALDPLRRRKSGLVRPASEGADGRPRRGLGIAVVVLVMLLQLVTDMVAGRDGARILARAAFMACELPILMFALSWAFRWCIRRRMSAVQGLLMGVGIAAPVGCVFGLLYGVLATQIPELHMHMPQGMNLTRSVLFGVLYAQLYLGLWALAFVFPMAVESARVRTLEAQQQRSQTELERLRAHLEPHFLLNTLNAIAGLVTEDPREARRLIACLGDLLREAVQDTSEQQSLERQLAWLRRYAQILEARHRGALRFHWDIPRECEPISMPRLLLQPLLENAVKHGALRRDDGMGEVTLRAELRDKGTLVCIVEDNGPGMPDAEIRSGAFGLQAVRRRLELEAPGASLRHERRSEFPSGPQTEAGRETRSEGTRFVVEIPRVG